VTDSDVQLLLPTEAISLKVNDTLAVPEAKITGPGTCEVIDVLFDDNATSIDALITELTPGSHLLTYSCKGANGEMLDTAFLPVHGVPPLYLFVM
jgi:hypothetical protein